MNGEPIISPWIFLIIDSLNGLTVALFFSIICCIVGTWVSFICIYETDYEEERLMVSKVIKRLLVAIVIIMFTMVAIPSEETAYKMLAAKFVTYENVELAGDTVKESVDYIFEKFTDLQDSKISGE